MSTQPNSAPLHSPPSDAERRPWAPPSLSVIDLADRTHTGVENFSDETSFTTASRYAPTS